MPTIDEIIIPSLLLAEGDVPELPPAGCQRLFIRAADHALCVLDAAGGVQPIGTGAGMSSVQVGSEPGPNVEAVADKRVYLKQVVLTQRSLLASISVYVSQTTDNAFGVAPVLMSDSAGVPDLVLNSPPVVGFGVALERSATDFSPPRWLAMPVGAVLNPGTYWIGVMFHAPGGTLRLAYADAGADRYYTSAGSWLTDRGRYAETVTTRAYAIRADLVPV